MQDIFFFKFTKSSMTIDHTIHGISSITAALKGHCWSWTRNHDNKNEECIFYYLFSRNCLFKKGNTYVKSELYKYKYEHHLKFSLIVH
jgi:hypothetical protein